MRTHEDIYRSTEARGPLAGLRVLDFSTALSGPLAAGIMADQGADVIKIEAPGGEVGRRAGATPGGTSVMFHMANRGKRSVELDLRSKADLDVALRLVEGADIVIQNYRPGKADRLGVGYEQLRQRRDDIILVSITGFGPDGPYAYRRAFDSVVQAASGVCDAQRLQDETAPPEFVQNVICDKIAAMAAAQAALAAVVARDHGRGGQHVEVPMIDVSVAFLWFDVAGSAAVPDDEAESAGVAPARRCLRFADGWGMISMGNDVDFEGACAAFGLDPGQWPELRTASGRRENPEILMSCLDVMEEVTRGVTRLEGTKRLDTYDVAFAMVNRISELPHDPQLVHSRLFRTAVGPREERVVVTASPVRFSGTPSVSSMLGPELGSHSDEVRRELWG